MEEYSNGAWACVPVLLMAHWHKGIKTVGSWCCCRWQRQYNFTT